MLKCVRLLKCADIFGMCDVFFFLGGGGNHTPSPYMSNSHDKIMIQKFTKHDDEN